MESMPTWLGQLISSGIVILVLGGLFHFSVGTVAKQIADLRTDPTDGTPQVWRHDIHAVRLGDAD